MMNNREIGKVNKWKFIHNGEGWWLRIENFEQLTAYAEKDNRASHAFENYLFHKMYDRELDNFGRAIELIGRKNNSSPMNASVQLNMEFYKTCTNHIDTYGFVNINAVGGCNGIDYPIRQVIFKENLSFPHFTENDVIIKTFRPQDYREGYKYHYYAYLGTQQITDGNQMKWDTEAEARKFARKFIN